MAPLNLPVLVLDGEQRSSLAITRSLGRSGAAVHVASASALALAGRSRWARSSTRLPDPLAGAAAYADAVGTLARRVGAGAVIPATDASVSALVAVRPRLPDGAVLLAPDAHRWALASDKAGLLARARGLGIGAPEEVVIAQDDDLQAVVRQLAYPVVLKPHRSVVPAGGGAVRLGVRQAADPDEAARAIATWPAAAFPVLAQRRVVGPGVGVFLLRWGGRIKAAFAHRRLREKPPSGGVSTYRESIPLDKAPYEASVRLLDGMDWEGLAMVEYKLDAATGTPFLMEINGRPWGSMQLAVDAGVDFPLLWLQHALGENPPAVTRYRTGVRSRWELGDLDHLLARLRHGDRYLQVAAGETSRYRAIFGCLRPWWPGDRVEVCRLSDPSPFLVELRAWLEAL